MLPSCLPALDAPHTCSDKFLLRYFPASVSIALEFIVYIYIYINTSIEGEMASNFVLLQTPVAPLQDEHMFRLVKVLRAGRDLPDVPARFTATEDLRTMSEEQLKTACMDFLSVDPDSILDMAGLDFNVKNLVILADMAIELSNVVRKPDSSQGGQGAAARDMAPNQDPDVHVPAPQTKKRKVCHFLF